MCKDYQCYLSCLFYIEFDILHLSQFFPYLLRLYFLTFLSESSIVEVQIGPKFLCLRYLAPARLHQRICISNDVTWQTFDAVERGGIPLIVYRPTVLALSLHAKPICTGGKEDARST